MSFRQGLEGRVAVAAARPFERRESAKCLQKAGASRTALLMLDIYGFRRVLSEPDSGETFVPHTHLHLA
jgi:hypothetical protein